MARLLVTTRRSPLRPRDVRVARVLAAAALALVGVVLLGAGLAGTPAPPPTVLAPPVATPPSTPGPSPGTVRRPAPSTPAREVGDRISGPVLPDSEPASLTIPDLDLRSPLVDLGLDADGALEVPQDPGRAGWFARGAAPGALGPAVIAGHVTWDGAPAVFHRLAALRRGDAVLVTRDDGRTAEFTVTRVAQFAKSQFPTDAVYGPIDHAGLRLITCGGTYDAARHRYLDNVVVFARLSATRGPRP
ncbi:Sortase family protein [Friedmanniella luteola]|uniref:Sortase family protein n=1 Tax=Friedmanniella luteola TaxID=546871 RepID=A0A1H1ZQQ5_9ACTN|nr:class F sortase [Friedmanniella luteola]SDT36034.1 Sortase family protein [Friedmanniella luteola]